MIDRGIIIYRPATSSWQAMVTKSLVRPFALFVQEPVIQLLGVYMAYLFGTLYSEWFNGAQSAAHPNLSVVFLTTMPSIFEGVYQQPVGIAGLHYIALGIGLTAASQLNARTMDKVYVYLKNKNGGVGKPEFRLRSFFPPFFLVQQMLIHLVTAAMFVGTLVLPVGLLITGWTVQAHTHWIAPDIVSAHSPQIIDSTQVWRGMQIGHRAHWCGCHSQLSVYSDVYH